MEKSKPELKLVLHELHIYEHNGFFSLSIKAQKQY